jgi:tetratricopeptide (TPR) repeat protein
MRSIILLALLAFPAWSQIIPASDDEQAIAKFESLIKAEQFAEANRQLETYTAAHGDSWRALYQLGYVYFRQRQIGPSLKVLSKSLAIHSEFGESHKILAFDLNILGRKDLAMAELEQAIRLTPNPWESRYELGRIFFERGSYLQAVEQLEQAKRLAPEFVKTYHNLGLAYGAIHDEVNAVKNFEEGLSRNARQRRPSAWPLIDYATYFNLQGDFEKARKLLLQAIQIDSSWAQEFEELSKSYRGLGQTDEAVASLKKAIALDPNKAETHYMLARLYSQTHQTEEAKQELAAYQRSRQRSQ